MGIWFKSVSGFLAGRKTYILAVLIIAVTLILVAFGKLTPETALTTALIFLGLFAASFRSALAAHSDQALALLVAVATAGKDLAAHNTQGALAAGTAAVQEGAQLGQEIQQGSAPNPPGPAPSGGAPQ